MYVHFYINLYTHLLLDLDLSHMCHYKCNLSPLPATGLHDLISTDSEAKTRLRTILTTQLFRNMRKIQRRQGEIPLHLLRQKLILNRISSSSHCSPELLCLL